MTQIHWTGIFRSKVAGTMRRALKSAGPLLALNGGADRAE
jgi:hypothetical protein